MYTVRFHGHTHLIPICWQRVLVGEAVREHAAKKQRLVSEVRRTGGAFGETKEELQRYLDDEEEMLAPDVAATPVIHTGSVTGNADVEKGRDIAKAHIAVPSQDDIMKKVLEEKKKALLDKYTTL